MLKIANLWAILNSTMLCYLIVVPCATMSVQNY